MHRNAWPLLVRISGVALLSFSFFASIQFLSYGCLSSMPGPLLSCYLGVEPELIPYLLATGAGVLLVGVLADPETRRARIAGPPPGLGFVVLGGAVIEIGMTQVHGFGYWGLSPLAPALFGAGVLLLVRGGIDWRDSCAAGEPSASGVKGADPERREGSLEATREQDGPRGTGILAALAVLLIGFGVFALLVGLVSKDGCVSIPDAYLCYRPGLEPSLSVPFVIVGGALLLMATLLDRELRWGGFSSPGWSVAFLVLAGGVLEVAMALYVFGDYPIGWTAVVYAPTLATTGALMAVRGARPPSPRRSAARHLAILGGVGVLLEIGYVWFFVSTASGYFQSRPSWLSYLAGWTSAEVASASVAYGLLFACALILWRWPVPATPPGSESRRHDGRWQFLPLLAADAAIFGTVVASFFSVWPDWSMSRYLVLGPSVHAVPFIAVLLVLLPPSQAGA